jgi:acyl-CoA thioesterase
VVFGTVVDAETKRPIPGAVIVFGGPTSVEALQAGTTLSQQRRLIANANGRFVVTGVPAGPLTLFISAARDGRGPD